jgi:hypothetical protein
MRPAAALGSLAMTGGPVTHDLLDDLPQTQYVTPKATWRLSATRSS